MNARKSNNAMIRKDSVIGQLIGFLVVPHGALLCLLIFNGVWMFAPVMAIMLGWNIFCIARISQGPKEPSRVAAGLGNDPLN
jgi:hypothetical protein